MFHQKVGTTDLRWCLGGWLSGTVPLRLFRELEEHFQNRELIYEQATRKCVLYNYFSDNILNMSHLLLLGKFEYSGGPIFKVVLEC